MGNDTLVIRLRYDSLGPFHANQGGCVQKDSFVFTILGEKSDSFSSFLTVPKEKCKLLRQQTSLALPAG